ncbi:hypothetical protein [Streptomyces sp. NPDC057740]
MAERVRVREMDGDEGRRLLRIIRRGHGIGGTSDPAKQSPNWRDAPYGLG